MPHSDSSTTKVLKLVIIIELEQYIEGPNLTDDNVLSKSQAMRSESN